MRGTLATCGRICDTVCVCVCVRVKKSVYVSVYNLILLVRELPRGRGKDYFAMRKAWVKQRNLS